MEHKTCEFCGTEYDSTLAKCPLCGRVNAKPSQKQPETAKQKRRLASSTGGARVAQKKTTHQNGWKVASIVLGILVILGIVGFFVIMDFGNARFDPNGIPTLMDGQKPEMPEETVYPEQEIQPDVQAPEEPAPEESNPAEPQPGECIGLTISQEEVIMENLQDKVFLTAVARPSDHTDTISYTSSDETVVTVSDSGMLTAVGPGEAEIRVTCGKITEICVVRCTFEASEEPAETPEDPDAKPEEKPDSEPAEKPEETDPQSTPVFASENLADFTCRAAGETVKLSFHNVPVGITITYESSDPKVATVSEDGVVTAVSRGQATITSTVGETKLTSIVRCDFKEGVSDGTYTAPFRLSHTDATLFGAGEQFTISLLDANGKKVEDVGWFASSDCVKIEGSTVTAVSKGQCNVTVVFQDVAYSCIVRCNF